ncbi:MAG: twin-arginine translocase subunit TatC [Candidatus Anaerobiospirillum merdipullorum]|uniref:Sec-independent protein translocase protein TatC n=1 Tax=Candidatus Anaerobiospirillum merdipullorum TaxID=2838450 RepID=A0A9E2NSM0_9GAMM|nr:twin-arginine translocase subunit TatC [Candidatus Anaerobiospirillum merdipullorum]
MSANKSEMSLIEHLTEMRRRLSWFLGCFILCALVLTPFSREIFAFILIPLRATLPADAALLSVGVISPVLTPLKVVLFCAFVLCLPVLIYEIWQFAAPGLYRGEKKRLALFMGSAILMFGLGAAYCYFVVLRLIFRFIANFAPQAVSLAPDIDAYVSFLTRLFLAFGAAFEIPVTVVLLRFCGLVSLKGLKKFRPYLIVLAFVIAAVLTPPDVASQLLLALPMVALYELGIIAAALFAPRSGATTGEKAPTQGD